MRLKYFLAIVVTFLIMGALFYKDRPENPLQTAEESVEQIQNKEANTTNPKIDQVIEKQASDSKIKEKSVQATDDQTSEINKAFTDHLKELATCLETPTLTVSGTAEPTFESLSTSLKTALGEVVVRMDDWTQLDFKAEDGTLKRIRTEIEYQDAGTPIRRAQLYKINAQGMPELQNLNPDQSTEPTDEFLDSLRGNGEVKLQEQGGRVYYEGGEELVMVERGGKVQSFSLTKGEKTFSCTETDATSSNCQCLN